MIWKVEKSLLSGTIEVPASKSHTIRALLISALAGGKSVVKKPLLTGDGYSALGAAQAIGAKYDKKSDNEIEIFGVAGKVNLADKADLQNSGTGLNLFCAAAATGNTPILFDGDESLRSRPMKSILGALQSLGAEVKYHAEFGKPPFTLCGKIGGGEVEIDGNNSQYLSSLLLVSPLLSEKLTIKLKSLFERPYVEMTLWWLEKQGIKYSADFDKLIFSVEPNQKYSPINETIAGDFSSATFPAVAAALTKGKIDIQNIDFSDPQGDKGIFEVIERMGASVQKTANGAIVSRTGELKGAEIDLNAMPDALPAISILATQASSAVKIFNVAQARIKETDRITAMRIELEKMGAKVEEFEDGMMVFPSKLIGAKVNSRGDHRIAMSMTLAGMVAEGETIVEGAEAAAVTYPSFREDFCKVGAKIVDIK